MRSEHASDFQDAFGGTCMMCASICRCAPSRSAGVCTVRWCGGSGGSWRPCAQCQCLCLFPLCLVLQMLQLQRAASKQGDCQWHRTSGVPVGPTSCRLRRQREVLIFGRLALYGRRLQGPVCFGLQHQGTRHRRGLWRHLLPTLGLRVPHSRHLVVGSNSAISWLAGTVWYHGFGGLGAEGWHFEVLGILERGPRQGTPVFAHPNMGKDQQSGHRSRVALLLSPL